MRVNSFIRAVFLLLFFLLTVVVAAQEGFKDEEAMANKADALFKKELYRQAYEYYQTLLSNHRENTLYSYRFGVCMMFSDKKDKEKPIRYIEVAANDPEMDIRVFYYLGRAYHQNYRFSEAKVAYQKYKTLAKSKTVAKFDIDRRIQECNNGLSLLSNIRLLYVINKVEVKESAFYRTYNMKSSGGVVIMKPENLITRYDKKHNKDFTAFYIPENRIIYYSSFGSKGVNGKDIYRAHQLSDGGWSEPQPLSSAVNTSYDEAYPFITKDGSTLYFSSTGHNSMGGYDIFKSSFNSGSFSWMKPENMNFPINTPFNDLFYVPDTSSRFASFASTRSSVDGLIYVYKIGTDKQEEEQDFAKVMKEGGDVTATIKLIKDVADMKTNIDIDDYKQKIKSITDTTTISKVIPSDSISDLAIKPADLSKPIVNLSESEAVDSAFSTYRELQYRVVGLKKQQKSIRRVYKKNKNLSEQILANQGREGEKEAAKYQEAANVANKIDVELSQEIASTEWAANKVIELASNMQYYQSNGKKDSVLSIHNQIITLSAGINYEENYSEKLLINQSDLVNNQREKASKFYELSNSYDREIEDLKAERDEYIAEESNTFDQAEKNDYRELISEMDTAITKKESTRDEYITKWKQERELADNLSEQATYTEKALSQYQDETKNIDYNNNSYINAGEVETVNATIVAIQTNSEKELIDVSKDLEPVIANNEIITEDDKKDIVTGNENIASNENVNSDTISQPRDKDINYLEQAESISLLSDIDKNIEKYKEIELEYNNRARVAKKIADKKYAEYQESDKSIEANYANLMLDDKISSENRVKKLQELKKDLVETNNLKKEAAAAYSISQVYEVKSNASKQFIEKSLNQKQKSIALIEEGKYNDAQEIAYEISNYPITISDENIIQANEESLEKLVVEENKLKYRQDSLKMVLADLEEEQRLNEEQTEAYITVTEKLTQQNEKLDKISLELDVVTSNKGILEQVNRTQKQVIASTDSDTEQNDGASLQNVPEEMRSKDNLVSTFSVQKLDQQLESIDETIAETQLKEEQKQELEYASMDVLEIPEYANEDQNSIANKVVKPRVEAIKLVETQNAKLDKMITLSLMSAIENNEKIKKKNDELQQAYSIIDTTISRDEQLNKIARVVELENEQLELNKKQEAAIQYTNILKKEKKENLNHIVILTEEVVKSKSYIARKQLDSVEFINNQNLLLTAISSDRGDYLDNHLKVYQDENKVLDLEITKLEQLPDSDINTERKIDSLNTLKIENLSIVAMVEKQANYINEKQQITKVDSSMVARSMVVPIIAINNDIFNPNYLEKNSIIDNIDFPRTKDNTLDSSNIEQKIAEVDAVVITANRISRNEIVYIKQNLIINEISTINDEIEVLTKMQNESFDEEEVSSIDGVITSLMMDTDVLKEELKRYDKKIAKIESKNIDVNFDANLLDVKQVLVDLEIMKDSLLSSSQQLRIDAEVLEGKAKRSKISEAEKNEKIAFELGLDAVDIIAKRNNRAYHENNISIAKLSSSDANGFDIPEARAFTEAAHHDKNAAFERREMIALGGFTDEEVVELTKEAEDFENQSIINQKKALAIYENHDFIVQNSDSIVRTAEEIPFDDEDDIRKEQAQELAANENNKSNVTILAPVINSSAKDSTDITESISDTTSAMDIAMQEKADQPNQIDIDDNGKIETVNNANKIVVVPVLTPSQIDSVENASAQQDLASQQDLGINNTNEIVVVPILTPSQMDSVENTSAQQDLASQQDLGINNTNEIVVVPILTPSQMDSIDVANNETNTVVEQGSGNNTNAENLALETQNLTPKEEDADISKIVVSSEVVEGSYGINTENNVVISNNEDAIPDNSELLPIGLVFKVQMAAFKRKVPKSTFKGISPVAAERIPNSSYIRYVGGVFPNYNYAKPARDIIRSKGFKDAFIVAYFDGKRISIAQARKLIASGKAYTSNGLVQFAIKNNTNYYVLSRASQSIASNEKSVNGIPSIDEMDNNSMAIDKSVSSKGMGINYEADINTNSIIPESNKMNGLVFKVQINALKQDVSLDYFKGISPIWKEKRPGSDLNYYIAGAFPNYVAAAEARDHIHTIGYPGAFIVVYFNGQRVSTEDANQLIKEDKAFTTASLAKYAQENNTEYYALASSKNTVLTIYYSVQIGVFGGPRSANRLFNLDDLYFNRTNSGYYRYFSGKYTNENTAKQARDQIRNIGVKDAFVVVFKNGKQVSLTSARRTEMDAKSNNITISRNGAASKIKSNTNNTDQANNVQVKAAQSEQGISFKVQLGAYKGTRNSSQLQLINSMSENGISSYTTASGLTIYFTNSYKSYQEAKSARTRIVGAGYTDVFVVAMQNGAKISVRKALDLLKQ
ncbi:MAG: PD40 domain-containing protein [Bacteroidales bacterium]|nr:PD40 domain-containing protein [Bacteroidales bacterium]